jgi:hypothetical protein
MASARKVRVAYWGLDEFDKLEDGGASNGAVVSMKNEHTRPSSPRGPEPHMEPSRGIVVSMVRN